MATPLLGAGFALAGTSPAGQGAPATADAPSRPVLGEARAIDVSRRDFTTDSGGSYSIGPGARQRVQLALGTVRNSSAVRDFGLEEAGDLVSDTTEVEMTDATQRALALLVAENVIKVLAITVVEVRPGVLERRVRFLDISTQREQTLAY